MHWHSDAEIAASQAKMATTLAHSNEPCAFERVNNL